jgi:transcriptional regulator GlxA family with amidase domain
MVTHHWVATAAETSFTGETRSCRELVEQAKKLALVDMDEPLHVSALCRALAVSERTLRKGFHKIHGLPPCRHLRMLRLSRARRALLSADRKLVTVTEIATSCGFVELGRFSVEYRKLFGESPSQTLHHAFGAELSRSVVLSKTVSLSEFDEVSFCKQAPMAASLSDLRATRHERFCSSLP